MMEYEGILDKKAWREGKGAEATMVWSCEEKGGDI